MPSHALATYRGTWSLTCRMLCTYSIGAPIGAGRISGEKHYHPFDELDSDLKTTWGPTNLSKVIMAGCDGGSLPSYDYSGTNTYLL